MEIGITALITFFVTAIVFIIVRGFAEHKRIVNDIKDLKNKNKEGGE